jgi:hypothetical protein
MDMADGGVLDEAAGSPQSAPVSADDFRIIRDNLAGGQRSTGDRLVPANCSPSRRSPASG